MVAQTWSWSAIVLLLLTPTEGLHLHHTVAATRRRTPPPTAQQPIGQPQERLKWVLGLNQYSHDAGACLLSVDGTRSVIVPKERVTRVKHDGGDTAAATRHALEAVGASLDDVVVACANNHHFRIAPFERRAAWHAALEINFGADASLVDDYNLIPGAPKHEISHHLAHAWSVLTQAPFDEGLIVVMDGMGELREEVLRAHAAQEPGYAHDELLPESTAGFVELPRAFAPHTSYREAETVYSFKGTELRRVFKRWQAHNSPPTLYNHGFENMESLGAVYSRISSHVFGDWNACGKVMGLAPWAEPWAAAAAAAAVADEGVDEGGGGEAAGKTAGAGAPGDVRLMRGELDGEGDAALTVDWSVLEALPHPNGWRKLSDGYAPVVGTAEESGVVAPALTPARDEAVEQAELRAFLARLSYSAQAELERVALSFLQRLQARTGATNICLVGGVALNSVLNGRIAREAGFERVFVPPAPGDEGIALGCAAYALHQLAPAETRQPAPPPWRVPRRAYQGKAYSAAEVAAAIEEYAPWLELGDGGIASGEAVGARLDGAGAAADGAELTAVQREAVEAAVAALQRGEVIAWFDGRAEVGARALGSRSILADPRRAEMHEVVNRIKRREMFRPLAPSVLADEVHDWFDDVPPLDGSPYMSVTASTRPVRRETVPAVTHVDGSARLQTVAHADAPLYHALILAFFLATGVPLVLNTSFNLAGMPIVESAADAVRCFLDAPHELSALFLQGIHLRRKAFPAEVAAARPCQQATFVSRCVSDAYGEARRVEVLVDGRWLQLTDALELEVLERSTGEVSVSRLAAELAEDLSCSADEAQAEVEARLRNLYELRLVSL